MKYIEGFCRHQQLMFPETVEQYISEENRSIELQACPKGLARALRMQRP